MLTKCLLFLVVLVAVDSKLLDLFDCKRVGLNCTIHSVDLAPCSSSWRRQLQETCRMSSRHDSHFVIHYTPDFKIKKLNYEVKFSEDGEYLSYLLSGSEDCEKQQCEPTDTGVNIVEAAVQPSGIPSGYYDLVWKMWDEDNEEKICCFETETIRVA